MFDFEVYRQKLIEYSRNNLISREEIAREIPLANKTLAKIIHGQVRTLRLSTLQKLKDYIDDIERNYGG